MVDDPALLFTRKNRYLPAAGGKTATAFNRTLEELKYLIPDLSPDLIPLLIAP